MKTLLSITVLCLVAVLASAQQYRTTVKTNAAVTAIEAQVVSTNLTVFTAASGVTWRQVTIQNQATNGVRFAFGAITGASNKLIQAHWLAPAGSNGSTVVYNYVIPTPLTISAQTASNNAANALVTSSLVIEALGN
jgi:hypothetical protein